MSASVVLETLAPTWRRARRTNTTDNGFPSKVPTTTRPVETLGNNAAQASASAIYDLTHGAGLTVQNAVELLVYGAGANNNTLSVRVIGWTQLIEPDNPLPVWIPRILAELAATLSSTPTGPTGGLVTTTDLFADTLTISNSSANAGVGIDVVSPANDTIAAAMIDLKGAQFLEFTFTTGGVATNCNALWRLL